MAEFGISAESPAGTGVEGSMSEPTSGELGLHRVLGTFQVLGQSVSGTAPSTAAAGIVPLLFATAGGGAWFTLVLVMIGMSGVAICISELATRHVSTGGIYSIVPKGLGGVGGVLGFVALLIVGLEAGIVITIGLANTLSQFLSSVAGIHTTSAELVIIEILGLACAAIVAYSDVRISTSFLFVVEMTTIALIVILMLIVTFKHGHIIDTSQLSLKGTTPHGMLVGIVIGVLMFAGFESSVALGAESKEPRRAIPTAVLGTVFVVGIFFIFVAYTQILGFEGTGINAATQTIPISTLSGYYHITALGDIALFGVSIAWFSCLCGFLMYVGRAFFTMGHDGIMPKFFTRTSTRTRAPHAAIFVWVGIWTVMFLPVWFGWWSQSDAFGEVATFGGYGFTFGYLLIALAAPAYFLRHGGLKPRVIVASLVAVVAMAIEFYYSFRPLPAAPLVWYVYAFTGLVVAGLLVGLIGLKVNPAFLKRIGRTEVQHG